MTDYELMRTLIYIVGTAKPSSYYIDGKIFKCDEIITAICEKLGGEEK